MHSTDIEINNTNCDNEKNFAEENHQINNKKKQDPSQYRGNISKRNRMTGKEYVGYIVEKKIIQKTNHPPGLLGDPCMAAYCKNSSKRKCQDFSENSREKLFTDFWQMKEKQ